MQKCAVAVGLLFLASAFFAQSPARARPVVIANLTLSSVTHLSDADRQTVIHEVQSRCCSSNETNEIKRRIISAFQDFGYFNAKLDKFDVTRLQPSGSQETLSVTATVNEGQQYRLKEISFVGAKAFPTDQLRGQFPIANSDIFNTEKIRTGLDDLRKLYAAQGYLNFTPVPNTEVDDATALISLNIDLDEGNQFHFGRLVLDGEEPRPGTGAKLIEAWKPYEGKLYDPQVVDQYWQAIRTLLPPGATQENTVAMRQDVESATVIPRINFPESK